MTITEFAQALQAKFAPDYAEGGPFEVLPEPVFAVSPGAKKYARITVHNGTQESVHCFVEVATGRVFKAAGWTGPAKGARFETMEDALVAADRYGSYLYARA